MVASVRYYYLFLLIFRRERNHTSLVGLAPSVALSSFGLVAVDDARSRKIFITCTFILRARLIITPACWRFGLQLTELDEMEVVDPTFI